MQKFEIYDHSRKAAIFAEILESFDKPVQEIGQIARVITPKEYLIDSWYSAAIRRRHQKFNNPDSFRFYRSPGTNGGSGLHSQKDKEE